MRSIKVIKLNANMQKDNFNLAKHMIHSPINDSKSLSEILQPDQRLIKVDLLRGLAIIGMIIFHACWDLSYFGFLSENIENYKILILLSRSVLVGFLFLSGFSLFLAYKNGINWKKFNRRLLVLLLVSALVTITTYLIFPQNFIYFGILHHLTLASVLGLFFLNLSYISNFIFALIFFIIPQILPLYSSKIFIIFGLNGFIPASFDFVPIFPWFGVYLLGLSAAKFFHDFQLLSYLRQPIRPHLLSCILQFFGRHSLIIYLAHQLILFSVVFFIYQIFIDRAPINLYEKTDFMKNCQVQCQENEKFCQHFCQCSFNLLNQQNLYQLLRKDKIQLTDDRIKVIINSCQQEAIKY